MPRRRLWLQFRLRTFLCALVGLAFVLGWLGNKVQVYRQEQAVIAAIPEVSQYTVWHCPRLSFSRDEYTFYSRLVCPSDTPAVVTVEQYGPNWRQRWLDWLGLEFMRRASDLSLRGPQYTDEIVPLICRLKNLKSIRLSRTMITADGIAQLQRSLPSCTVRWDRILLYDR